MKRVLIAVGLATVLVGCGGSGGGGSDLGGGSRVALFMTDSMDGNDHVWVTVKSVDLLTSSGSTNVFVDLAGRPVDLKTLRDGSGERFQFLNEDAIPAGTYTGARVVLAKDLVIFPHLATDGTPMTFDNQYDDGAGNSAISFSFNSPKQVGGDRHEIVIDFDLANWNAVGNVVTVSLKEGGNNGLGDSHRHERTKFNGTIADLGGSEGSFTFTLSHEEHSFPVVTTAETVVFQEDGSAGTLANGKRVVVEGNWDTTLDKFVAVSVRVKKDEDQGGEEQSEDEAEGHVTEFKPDQGFVRIAVHEAEGFVPLANSVRFEFTENTVFLDGNGGTLTKEQFFAALSNGVKLEGEGTYNEGTHVLTADHIKLDDDEGDENSGSGGGDDSV